MVINFDEKSDKCCFDQCVYNDSGKCLGVEERDACVEMALKMLGVYHAKNASKDSKG